MNTGLSESFQAVCEAAQADWDVPALAVATLLDGRSETVTLGCEPATRFRIASVTKPMVAGLALSLLELDETTGVWPDDVRVRHLLSHTSGFDCELSDRDYARFGRGDDALERCAAELPSVRRLFGIEQVWSYANTGYWLAGALCGRRAGSSFEEALAERVLRPAGLLATSFDEPDLEGFGPNLPAPPYPRARRPSGGLVSTVADVLRFGAWHLARPESAPQRVVAGRPVGGVYGLGLFGERVAGFDVWGHPGSYGGFEASLLTIPARGAVFVGLTNAERGRRALRRIEDAWLTETVGAPRAVAPRVELSPDVLAGFAGRYATPDGIVEVEPSPHGLRAVLPDGTATVAHAIGERTFEVSDGDDAGLRFDFPRPGFARIGSRAVERLP
jgi:CubicO group peptidase (beta-lactamase class C family)